MKKLFFLLIFLPFLTYASFIWNFPDIPLHFSNVIVAKKKENNICFHFIQKCASSSLREVFFSPLLTKYSPEIFSQKDYIHVICIRDPLSRIISSYLEIMKLRNESPVRRITAQQKFYKEKNNVIYSFQLFLEAIQQGYFEPHLSPQYLFLEKKNLSLKDMDFIILFENLEEDYNTFCKKYHFHMPPKKRNVGTTSSKKILENFIENNVEAQRIIHKIYEKDFQLYEEAKKIRLEKLHIKTTKRVQPIKS